MHYQWTMHYQCFQGDEEETVGDKAPQDVGDWPQTLEDLSY